VIEGWPAAASTTSPSRSCSMLLARLRYIWAMRASPMRAPPHWMPAGASAGHRPRRTRAVVYAQARALLAANTLTATLRWHDRKLLRMRRSEPLAPARCQVEIGGRRLEFTAGPLDPTSCCSGCRDPNTDGDQRCCSAPTRLPRAKPKCCCAQSRQAEPRHGEIPTSARAPSTSTWSRSSSSSGSKTAPPPPARRCARSR